MFTIFFVFIFTQIGYNIRNDTMRSGGKTMSFSITFWLCIVVLALCLVAVLTAAFKDDKTKGL